MLPLACHFAAETTTSRDTKEQIYSIFNLFSTDTYSSRNLDGKAPEYVMQSLKEK